MREIRQSGSEGGAALSRPYPYLTSIIFEPLAKCVVFTIAGKALHLNPTGLFRSYV